MASPVLAAVFLTLLFLLLSTCIPGLQPLPLHRSHRKPGSRPRAPCPYKSPQSWAFLYVVAYCKRPFKFLADIYNFKSFTPLFGADLGDSWIKHGLFWLCQRDIDGVASHLQRLASVKQNRFSELPADTDSEPWILHGVGYDSLLRSLCSQKAHFSPLYDGVHAHLQVKQSILTCFEFRHFGAL